MIKIKKILFLSFTLLLSSCSVYKRSFDCKAHKGIGCESVSKVNELVDDDRLDEFTDGITDKKFAIFSFVKDHIKYFNDHERDMPGPPLTPILIFSNFLNKNLWPDAVYLVKSFLPIWICCINGIS